MHFETGLPLEDQISSIASHGQPRSKQMTQTIQSIVRAFCHIRQSHTPHPLIAGKRASQGRSLDGSICRACMQAAAAADICPQHVCTRVGRAISIPQIGGQGDGRWTQLVEAPEGVWIMAL